MSVLAALAGPLLAAAPASAARTWHAPVQVSTEVQALSSARIAVDPQGDAVAVWIDGETAGTGAHFPLGVVQAATRPAGGAWQAPVDISDARLGDATVADVAIDAQGDAVALWSRYGNVQSAVRPAGAAWQAPVNVASTNGLVASPQLVVDPAGDAIAVWTGYDATGRVVQSAVRPAGGTWQAPVDVSSADLNTDDADVGVDAQGDAVAVWGRSSADPAPLPTGSAVRPAGGIWQAPSDIPLAADGLGPVEGLRLAVDARGNAVAVWQRSGPTANVLQGSVRPAGGTWHAPTDISTGDLGVGAVDVAFDAQGNAVAVWDRFSDSAGIVQSASLPANGTWQAPVVLAAEDQPLRGAEVAVDPQGDAIAVWWQSSSTAGAAQSAVRPVGGAWQGPLDISSGDRFAADSQVAFDANGDAVAIWVGSHGIRSADYDSAPPPPPGPTPPLPPPTLSGLRLSPRTFRAARSGPAVKPAAAARTATRVTYTLSEPASVRFTVRRLRAGRRVGGRCVKPAHGNRGRHSCTRSVVVPGSFTRHRSAGGDRFTFTGRLAGRALRPGAYSLAATATATSNGRSSAPVRVRLHIER